MKQTEHIVIPERKKNSLVRAADYESYKKKLEEFRALDRRNNFSADMELNEMEKQLDDLMHSIREADMNQKYVCIINDTAFNEFPAAEPREYYPIHPFNEVKDNIERNCLFPTFQRMPKGGNLHIHTSATLSTEKFITLLREFDNHDHWAVFVWKRVNDKKPGLTDGTLLLLSKQPGTDPGVAENLKRLRDFTDDELKAYYSFMNPDHTREVKYIWDEFNLIFSRVSKILTVKEFYKEYYRRAFQELADDNIDYVELRFGMAKLVSSNQFEVFTRLAGWGYQEPKSDAIRVIWETYQEFVQTHKDFRLKLILSGSRKKSDEDVRKKIDQALKETYEWMHYPAFWAENFVIGYDLVSEEDRGNNTDFYAEAIYNSAHSRDISFYFHDGESCWADDDNLYAAAALGTKRVGHGLNLFRFPSLVDSMKTHHVAMEVCPVSNQLLRYTLDLRMHLIGEYMNRGVECVVCSDDPSILGNGGLAYDFWEVYYSQLIDLKALKKLILNSYIYSGMTQAEYNQKIAQWKEKWAQFVENEVKELRSIKNVFSIE